MRTVIVVVTILSSLDGSITSQPHAKDMTSHGGDNQHGHPTKYDAAFT